jgi:signal transduction histidine kinase/CheY-like chemotaxis protein
LLRRQLTRHAPGGIPPELEDLVAAIDQAYQQADADRLLLERSLDLTSSELLDRNAQLRSDIAARRRMEDELRRSEARLRGILGTLPDLLLLVSSDYVICDAHDRGPNEQPILPGNYLGRSLRELMPADVFALLAAAVDSTLAGDPAPALEFPLPVKGQILHLEVRTALYEPACVAMIIRDQTERQRLTERLRIADRMASVGTLAAGVAHEINNPLTYVLGNLEHVAELLARADAPLRAELRAPVGEAIVGARRVRETVRDLRVFSHPGSGPLTAVDVHRVLDSSLRMASNELRHRAVVIRDYGDLPPALGDEAKLSQVFVNLAVNAAQAMPVGDVANNEILVRTRAVGEELVIEISDTGVGIPEGMESRIFEPFVTTKPSGEGTGLGLSICRGLVEALRGELSAHRRCPRGTTMRVVLRAASASTGVARFHTGAATPAQATRRLRVLLVDDDELVTAALARVLREHEPEIANTGADALGLLDERDYDVVLCDLMMPELSGMRIYEETLARRPLLAQRFVFMTGGVFTDAAREFLQRVPNHVVEKPTTAAAIRRLLADWPRATAEEAVPGSGRRRAAT